MSRTSTGRADASPPDSRISRSTVLIVEYEEFGSGGKGTVSYALEVVLAATTTDLLALLSFSFESVIDDGHTGVAVFR